VVDLALVYCISSHMVSGQESVNAYGFHLPEKTSVSFPSYRVPCSLFSWVSTWRVLICFFQPSLSAESLSRPNISPDGVLTSR
jgi:hypothetical protein